MSEPKNDITELRGILFDTLRGLKDKENPVDIAHAQAVSDVAQTIINSAKVEIDYCRATGETTSSGFIPLTVQGQGEQPSPHKSKTIPTGNGYIHKMGV